jgi:Clp amino terminal domain, pathogenicity island component
MFERFAADARNVVHDGWKEAQAEGAATVEAEHLLLALTLKPEVQKLGLDHDEIVEALAREEERSLAAVGINRGDYDAPVSHRLADNPKLGASAKLAIQRALTVTTKRGQRRITIANLLLGLLGAEHGRVPRALQLAGIDPHDLRARL